MTAKKIVGIAYGTTIFQSRKTSIQRGEGHLYRLPPLYVSFSLSKHSCTRKLYLRGQNLTILSYNGGCLHSMHLLHFVSVLAFRPSMGEIAIREQMEGMEWDDNQN